MANSITFTSAPLMQNTNITSTLGIGATTILNADATYDRRIYGISVYSGMTGSYDAVISVTSPSAVNYKLTTVAIGGSSGYTNAIAPIDVLGHTQMAPFVKQRDASGAAYYNLPKSWSMQIQLGATAIAGREMNVSVIGETYA